MIASAPTVTGLAGVCATRDLLVVCGAGGVGKTTVAAALALTAAVEQGGRVLVLTVDPARRLADALGLQTLGNVETRVVLDPARFGTTRGELWAAMLDPRAGWDDLIARHAPDDATRERLIANPLYRDVTGRFAHSHEYLAMERLHEVHVSGRYDLVIVDTPPSTHAVDVLDAPGRMIDFFESRLLRWLTVPARSSLLTLASRPFYQVLDRVLGARFGEDLSEMFGLLARLRPGFVARAGEVRDLLADQRTAYAVVTTTEDVAMAEARRLVAALGERSLAPAAVIVNRAAPSGGQVASGSDVGTRLEQWCRDAAAVDQVATLLQVRAPVLRTVILEMARRSEDLAMFVDRERQRLFEASALAPVVGRVPTLDVDIAELDTLVQVGDALWRGHSRGAD